MLSNHSKILNKDCIAPLLYFFTLTLHFTFPGSIFALKSYLNSDSFLILEVYPGHAMFYVHSFLKLNNSFFSLSLSYIIRGI